MKPTVQQAFFGIIENQLGTNQGTFTPRIFRKAFGRNTAEFVSQLLYWTEHSIKETGWVAKSFKEWKEELGFGRHIIESVRSFLSSKGLLEIKLRKYNGSPTVHYKLNLEALLQYILKIIGEIKGPGSAENPGNEDYVQFIRSKSSLEFAHLKQNFNKDKIKPKNILKGTVVPKDKYEELYL